ncbi:TerB family tellurite resistance protein [Myxococcota bacterium]|nr:TerB family tellurite resistance protein [Myxococcota bacterium]
MSGRIEFQCIHCGAFIAANKPGVLGCPSCQARMVVSPTGLAIADKANGSSSQRNPALFGKIFGGVAGAILFGPVGAVIGAGLGHFAIDENSDTPGVKNSDNPDLVFIEVLMGLFAKMAKADGHISEEEVSFIDSVIQLEWALPPEGRKWAIDIFKSHKNSSITFNALSLQAFDITRSQPGRRPYILQLLFAIAAADNILDPGEKTLLEEAQKTLKVDAYIVDSMWEEYFGMAPNPQNQENEQKRRRQEDPDFRAHKVNAIELSAAYSTLGCKRGDDKSKVKKNYRDLIRHFHPDSIESKDLHEDFKRFANTRIQEVNAAWDKVSTYENWG